MEFWRSTPVERQSAHSYRLARHASPHFAAERGVSEEDRESQTTVRVHPEKRACSQPVQQAATCAIIISKVIAQHITKTHPSRKEESFYDYQRTLVLASCTSRRRQISARPAGRASNRRSTDGVSQVRSKTSCK